MTNDTLSDADYAQDPNQSKRPGQAIAETPKPPTQTQKPKESRQFLQSSAIVFVANIFTAFLNYFLIILVSRSLSNDYSIWTSLTSFLAISSSLSATLTTNLIRQVTLHQATNLSDAQSYLLKYQSLIGRLVLNPVVITSLVTSLFYGIYTSNTNWLILTTLAIYQVAGLYVSLQHNYLMGVFRIIPFSISGVLSTLVRFGATFGLLYFGFGIWALPLGLMAALSSLWLITYIFVGRYYEQNNLSRAVCKSDLKLNLKSEFTSLLFTMMALFLLSSVLNISPIISQLAEINPEAKDLLAVLFNFGQIIFFGATACLGTLVAYTAKKDSKLIFGLACSLVSIFSLGIGLVFAVFGNQLMSLFNRTSYSWAISLILLYTVFVAIYNIIFVAGQYSIARHNYRLLGFLALAVVVPFGYLLPINFATLPVFDTVITLVNQYSDQMHFNQIRIIAPLILLHIIGCLLALIPIIVRIVTYKKQIKQSPLHR